MFFRRSRRTNTEERLCQALEQAQAANNALVREVRDVIAEQNRALRFLVDAALIPDHDQLNRSMTASQSDVEIEQARAGKPDGSFEPVRAFTMADLHKAPPGRNGTQVEARFAVDGDGYDPG